MPRTRGKWEYRGYWIDNNVRGSSYYYAYWYEFSGPKRTRKVCRKSLKTERFEDAQDALIRFVLDKATEKEDALVISVLRRYTEEVTAKLPSAGPAARARELFLATLDGSERVCDLTEKFQRKHILRIWREDHRHSVGYMSRNMSVLAAAIEYCGIKDAPKIYYNKNWIAEKLRVPAPVSGRWIPPDDDLARFIDALTSDKTFYWLIISMNTACRPEAAIDLGPDQIDFETRLVHLNPEGRPQEATKHRPSVRLTENLAGWAEAMPSAIQDTNSLEEQHLLAENKPWKLRPRFVPYRTVDSLQVLFNRTKTKEDVNLPKLVPYSIRHKMTTVLRTKQVPEDQIALMLGHKRPEYRTTRLYGEYDPTYLTDAANAIDEYLFELNKKTDRNLFSPTYCHPASDQAVIDLSRRKRGP